MGDITQKPLLRFLQLMLINPTKTSLTVNFQVHESLSMSFLL